MSKSIDLFGTFKQSFKDLYTSQTNSDVTLVIGEKKFPVHRLILANRSDFFMKLFYENQFNEAGENIIPIDAPLDAFEMILQFIYYGEMDLNSSKGVEAILEVLELSTRYNLVDLQETLLDQIGDIIDPLNVELITKAAHLVESKKLLNACCKCLNDPFNVGAIQALTERELYSVLSNAGRSITNISKFKMVATWFEKNLAFLDKEKLLNLIDFSVLTNHQLIYTVGSAKIADNSRIMEILMSRKFDVREEVLPNQYIPIIVKQCNSNFVKEGTVVTGTIDNDGIITGEKVNGQWNIVLDIGYEGGINKLVFDLMENLHEYSISFSKVNDPSGDWSPVMMFKDCSRLQKIYFQHTFVRYIKIIGIKTCKNFKICYIHYGPPANHPHSFLKQRENIFTPQTCYLAGPVDVSTAALIDGNFKSAGIETPYTEISSDGLEIRFNQPFVLNHFGIRFWDYDGRMQSLDLYTIQDVPKLIKSFDKVDGWQYFQHSDLQPMRGIKIVPKETQTHNLRLVHIEGCFKN